MYHGIIPKQGKTKCETFFSLYTHTLDNHFQWLRRFFRPIHPLHYLEQLRDGKSLPPRSVLVTFDDGLQNFFDYALPIARKHNIVPLLFCNTRNLDQKDWLWFSKLQAAGLNGKQAAVDAFMTSYHQYSLEELHQEVALLQESEKDITPALHHTLYDGASTSQIRTAHRNGEIIVGGHTNNHPRLVNESDEALKAEIQENKAYLEKLVGEKLDFFAYPEGVFDERVANCVKESGYSIAFTTDKPSFPIPQNLELYAIPRIGLYRSGHLYFFLKVLRS